MIELASRKLLAQRVSISMNSALCRAALEEAFAKCGPPESFNTRPCSQFTSETFTNTLKARAIQISMYSRVRVARHETPIDAYLGTFIWSG